jgi:cytochrome o ubiquinol oxidase subunit 3
MASVTKAGADTVLWNASADSHDVISGRTYGFWLYILSDALIISGILASYAVLDNSTGAAGGPLGAQFLSASQGLVQSLIILASVLSLSLATVAVKAGNKALTSLGLLVAGALAVLFIFNSWTSLASLAAAGDTPFRSAYLSVFFTLIGTHALHLVFGLLWIAVLLVQIATAGFTELVVARLLCLRLFWQFQGSVWAIVYIYVYLFGGAH